MKTPPGKNQQRFKSEIGIDVEDKMLSNLQSLINILQQKDELPILYVIIDEYDDFANQPITTHKDKLHRQLTSDESFLKTFFKTPKEGRETGTTANVFITGVLPIAIYDMASGRNIANFITPDTEFEAMLGFTKNEVNKLLAEAYHGYEIEPALHPPPWKRLLKAITAAAIL